MITNIQHTLKSYRTTSTCYITTTEPHNFTSAISLVTSFKITSLTAPFHPEADFILLYVLKASLVAHLRGRLLAACPAEKQHGLGIPHDPLKSHDSKSVRISLPSWTNALQACVIVSDVPRTFSL